MGFAGAGRAEEHDLVAVGDEVQGVQVRDGYAFEAAGVVGVELLQRLAGREPSGADPALATVGLAPWPCRPDSLIMSNTCLYHPSQSVWPGQGSSGGGLENRQAVTCSSPGN